MIKVGVIGHPINHSKSPIIHNEWIRRYGISGTYEAIDIKPEDLAKRLPQLLYEENYMGFNLTAPHKELALSICDEVDNIAKKTGAVNTVFIQENGDGRKICGTNTDAYGFIENVKSSQPKFPITAGPAVVLGAGGAARAIVYSLLKEGVKDILILNRSRKKAEAIAEMDKEHIRVKNWDMRNDVLRGANILVNTTILGMVGQKPLDLSLKHLPPSALVADIVYAPLMTPLLIGAQARGCSIVTGIGMLIYQAAPSFQSWFGILPDIDKSLIKKVLGK